MLVATEGCELDLARGPGCLIVRVRNFQPEAPEATDLAERLWTLAERHMIYRLVLELDDIDILRTILIAQLICLHRRIAQRDGVVHLAGLSPYNQEVLRTCRLDERLPVYDDRFSAAKGGGPHWPR
ncbi:MAG: hypothetical protein JW818_11005 [Pirellulales bacterium]|nr:hypothetical protein [Pirellulales bacterium]